jgi:anti-sigma factor RsiW
MTEMSCEEVEQMLVDYGDGYLSPSESTEVSGHLAKCRRCREMLKALQRSLELADVIWQDGLAEVEAIRADISAKRRWAWQRYAAIAAGILVVLGVGLLWRGPARPSRVEPSFAEIERTINEAGTAARLLAATERFADQPWAEALVKSQYRYIVDKYPDTQAAVQARLKVNGTR